MKSHCKVNVDPSVTLPECSQVSMRQQQTALLLLTSLEDERLFLPHFAVQNSTEVMETSL